MQHKIFLAAALFAALGSPALAQDKKTKTREEKQIITITRDGEKEEKLLIEIEGDKVKINGKESKPGDSNRVNIHRFNTGALRLNGDLGQTMRYRRNGNDFNYDNYNFNWGNAGDTNRAFLGVYTSENAAGAEITSVSATSPADKAGLQTGDVITRVGDAKVSSPDDLSAAIGKHKVGDKVRIDYLRSGKAANATVELGRSKRQSIGWGENFPQPRIRIEDMDLRLPNNVYIGTNRAKLDVSVEDLPEGKGVKITDAETDGAGYKGGLREGDIITHVDGEEIDDTSEIGRILRVARPGTQMKIGYSRGGKKGTADVTFPKPIRKADL